MEFPFEFQIKEVLLKILTGLRFINEEVDALVFWSNRGYFPSYTITNSHIQDSYLTEV